MKGHPNTQVLYSQVLRSSDRCSNLEQKDFSSNISCSILIGPLSIFYICFASIVRLVHQTLKTSFNSKSVTVKTFLGLNLVSRPGSSIGTQKPLLRWLLRETYLSSLSLIMVFTTETRGKEKEEKDVDHTYLCLFLSVPVWTVTWFLGEQIRK